MTGPLDGIKVVESTVWIQGPYTGAVLGDLGADIIKIEDTIGGDPSRAAKTYTQFASDKVQELGRSFSYEFNNRNKRGIALNLRKEEGRQIVYKLIREADIFISNFRLGVTDKLGLDYDTLSSHNPRLIYAQVSGWGMKGPDSKKRSLELSVMAKSGWMYHFGGPDDPPLLFVAGIGDQLAGITAVLAILAALFAREQTGVGQFMDISALGSLIMAAGSAITNKLIYGEEYPRRSRTGTLNPLVTYYKCQDGRWLYLNMLQSDRFWADFCRVLHIEELEHDARFENYLVRGKNSEELIAILDKVFATKPLSEWLELFEQKGNLMYAPIQTVSEMITDPQVVANEYIMDYDDPGFGPMKIVGFPYKFDKTPPSLRRPAPQHGQHTEEILLENGYTWEDISRLKDEGVIL